MAQSTIVVRRDARGYRDLLRAYRVLLDGREVGRIRRGECLTIETDPGEHEIHFAIDWCRSPTTMLNLVDGEEVRLRPHSLPWPLLLAWPYFLTFGRSKYIAVEGSIDARPLSADGS
jgi:hypothetical protein